jgi:hypothetical protein
VFANIHYNRGTYVQSKAILILSVLFVFSGAVQAQERGNQLEKVKELVSEKKVNEPAQVRNRIQSLRDRK